jgi:phage-related tail protein
VYSADLFCQIGLEAFTVNDIKFVTDEERKALQVARIQSTTIEAQKQALADYEAERQDDRTLIQTQRVRIAELEAAIAAQSAAWEQERNTADELAKLVVELKTDAERYRWLRDGNDAKHSKAMQIAAKHFGLEWDDLIDAAMKEKT